MKNKNVHDAVNRWLAFGFCLVFLVGFPHSGICAWQALPGFPGWQIDYNFVYNGYTTDLYAYNGTNRFWYNVGPGQWFDRSAVNGAWSVLGPAGQSRSFIGDHNWHPFNDNRSFMLHSNNDWGVWWDAGAERFLYDYNRGQWCDHSVVNATWSCLGPDKQLSAYIGDHNWHQFTDNRSYQFHTNNQWGVWQESGQYRFLYDYTTGQWKDRSVGNGTWSNLGPTNQLSAYIGDHSWHDFGNGITYRFYDNNAWGTFRQDGTYRFLYDYSTGQWKHRSTADGTWYGLGDPGQLSAWISDGTPHDLWNAVTANFQYDSSAGSGGYSWNASGVSYRYTYTYGSGAWSSYYDGTAAGFGVSFGMSLGGQRPDRLSDMLYSSLQSRVMTNVNDYRQKGGLGKLSFVDELNYIALGHSQNMANTGVFAHESPAFPSGWQTFVGRFQSIGWSQGQIAENLSLVPGSVGIGGSYLHVAKTAVDLWYNEGPENGDGKEHGHYMTMMNSNYKYGGIGLTGIGSVWVTMDYAQDLNGWHAR